MKESIQKFFAEKGWEMKTMGMPQFEWTFDHPIDSFVAYSKGGWLRMEATSYKDKNWEIHHHFYISTFCEGKASGGDGEGETIEEAYNNCVSSLVARVNETEEFLKLCKRTLAKIEEMEQKNKPTPGEQQ